MTTEDLDIVMHYLESVSERDGMRHDAMAAVERLREAAEERPVFFKWTITIEASEALVADGFDVANQIDGEDGGGELSELGRIVDRVETYHCRLRIIDAPRKEDILRVQGEPPVTDS